MTKVGYATHIVSVLVAYGVPPISVLLGAHLDADWQREPEKQSSLVTLDFAKVFIGLFSYFHCFLPCFW